MFTKILITTAAAAGVSLAVAAPASAGQPAERACLGEFLSDGARTFGAGFGHDFVFFAQNADQIGLRNLGDGIHILQAGESAIYPDVCQAD